MKIFLIYLLLMNIAGFAAMGIDKCKAKAHAWRIFRRICTYPC